MNNEYRKFGTYLRKARIKKGMTQKQVSDYLGYSSAQFISNFECGRVLPPVKKLKHMVPLLKLDPNVVLKHIIKEYKSELRRALI